MIKSDCACGFLPKVSAQCISACERRTKTTPYLAFYLYAMADHEYQCGISDREGLFKYSEHPGVDLDLGSFYCELVCPYSEDMT